MTGNAEVLLVGKAAVLIARVDAVAEQVVSAARGHSSGPPPLGLPRWGPGRVRSQNTVNRLADARTRWTRLHERYAASLRPEPSIVQEFDRAKIDLGDPPLDPVDLQALATELLLFERDLRELFTEVHDDLAR